MYILVVRYLYSMNTQLYCIFSDIVHICSTALNEFVLKILEEMGVAAFNKRVSAFFNRLILDKTLHKLHIQNKCSCLSYMSTLSRL